MDLRAALRRRKPDKRRRRLSPRPRHELADWTVYSEAAPIALVLDTGVYIHSAAGRLPPDLGRLLDRALCSTVRLRWPNWPSGLPQPILTGQLGTHCVITTPSCSRKSPIRVF